MRKNYHSSNATTIEKVGPPKVRGRYRASVDEALAKLPYEIDELLAHVSNKLKLLDVSIARNSIVLGRIYNKVTGEELDTVELDGIVIKQLFEFTGEGPPVEISTRSTYRVHHDEVRRWYALAVEAKSPSRSRRRRRATSRSTR